MSKYNNVKLGVKKRWHNAGNNDKSFKHGAILKNIIGFSRKKKFSFWFSI